MQSANHGHLWQKSRVQQDRSACLWKPCLRSRKCWRSQFPNYLKIKKPHGETSFRQDLRLTVRFILCPVIQGASNGGKALQAGDDHIVGSAGAVNDQQIAVFIPAAHNANMGVLWIKHQIAGLGLLPGDGKISKMVSILQKI